MNKLEIYNYLKKINIWHEITEHKAVYNMAELAQIDIPYPNSEAKNLFVRDDKKRNYYLITIKGNKKVNLKEFQKTAGTRPLSFASESDLMNTTCENFSKTAGTQEYFKPILRGCHATWSIK